MSQSTITRLVWLDLEMTGLDPDKESIIEIATIVTDTQLNIVAEGPDLIIHQPDSLLDQMDSWNTEHHGKSGLTDAVRASTISLHDAETKTLDFLKEHLAPNTSPLCGNTIGQDRRFLVKYMPELANFFHYRNLDVTSFKIAKQLWRPDIASFSNKELSHRALADVKESIDEMRHYREQWLK